MKTTRKQYRVNIQEIRDFLLKNNMTHSEFVEMIGISKPTLYDIFEANGEMARITFNKFI